MADLKGEDVSAEVKTQAEELKNEGNAFVKGNVSCACVAHL